MPGVDATGIHGVQTLDDGERLLDELEHSPREAVVVGGGYIGIEMAEAMVNRGLQVTVLTRSAEPMATLDPDMGRLVHTAMEAMGIDVRTEVRLDGFETDEAGHVRAVATGDGDVAADLVVLGTGVGPETTLARAAGLTLGRWGGLVTDLQMRVFDAEGIWAAGDCVESIDLVSGNRVHVALGTHANKQGRVLGTNLGGGYATFPGVVGTAVSKVCELEIARTGLREADCDAVGYRWLTVTVESTTRAGYYPDAAPITVKLVVERRTGRLLGGQIVGREGAAKRIDALAVALWNQMTVEEIAMLDLGYAPPFSPVWDPVPPPADLRRHGLRPPPKRSRRAGSSTACTASGRRCRSWRRRSRRRSIPSRLVARWPLRLARSRSPPAPSKRAPSPPSARRCRASAAAARSCSSTPPGTAPPSSPRRGTFARPAGG